MSDDYRKLKIARLLYAVAKDGFRSVPEGKKVEPEKIYTVKMKGDLILAVYQTAKSLFRETKRLQNFLEKKSR